MGNETRDPRYRDDGGLGARLDGMCIAAGAALVRGAKALWRGIGSLLRGALHLITPAPRDPTPVAFLAPPLPSAAPQRTSVGAPPPLPHSGARHPADPPALPYRRAKGLLSKGERAAWVPLLMAVEGKYRLFCKVRLADVVTCPPLKRGQPPWFKKIRGYHVDFVVCEPVTTAPLLVIELDDRSHRTTKATKRDKHKDAVLAAAGVPILRIPAQQAYAPVELREQIERGIATSNHKP